MSDKKKEEPKKEEPKKEEEKKEEPKKEEKKDEKGGKDKEEKRRSKKGGKSTSRKSGKDKGRRKGGKDKTGTGDAAAAKEEPKSAETTTDQPPGAHVQGDGLSSSFVDAIIRKVRTSPVQRFTDEITDEELKQLCKAATDIFRMQPTLVRIQPPVVIVGDIHGQFTDLQRIFNTHGNPPEQQYVFLGDYVDRGPQSLETIVLLFCYKVKYPANFMLLRGNHECADINRVYGFFDEVNRRYQHPGPRRLYDLFNQTFAWMPFVGLVGEKILCMHGGISDQIRSLDQLSNLLRPQTVPLLRSLEVDLLWSDPSTSITGVAPNSRGAGVMFGADVVESVRNLLGIDYIVRAHQLVMDGVEYFADRHLITLFSAPRYTGKNNTGATLLIAPDLSHTITRFPPA